MKDLAISPFEPEDLESISVRTFDLGWSDLVSTYTRDNGYVVENLGPAYTARLGGRVVFCAGIYMLWEGVGELWSIADESAARLAYEVYVWQRQLLKTEINTGDFHRLQAHVALKWVSACRYVERLGFEKEAVVRKYGADCSDYILYGRVF